MTICVFASSSQDLDPRYNEAAKQLGRLIASQGHTLVNGAGSTGLMRHVSDGALDAGGRVVGIIPKFMVDKRLDYDRLQEVVVTADMHQRKQMMQQMSDAIVALPGGVGTLEELLEAITWRQLKLIDKPIILLNTLNYFDPLADMLSQAARQGFMKTCHTSLYALAETPDEVMSLLNE